MHWFSPPGGQTTGPSYGLRGVVAVFLTGGLRGGQSEGGEVGEVGQVQLVRVEDAPGGGAPGGGSGDRSPVGGGGSGGGDH